MQVRTLILLLVIGVTPPHDVGAAGHGPVFGGATPTLGQGGWSLDQAWMGRIGESGDVSQQLLRTMISFGVTEDLQISGSLPVPLNTAESLPMGRMMALMSAHREFETLAAWRFHRQTVGTSARFETTAYVGGTIPFETRRAGVRVTPSTYTAVASGYASRSHYFWLGGGYQRYFENQDDRLGDTRFYSVVYGYRPKRLRLDYPRPDLRFFVEAVGEANGKARRGGTAVDAGGHVLMVGPTALLLYKAYGIEGGLLFPVAQQRNDGQAGERFRFGLNVSYFFWLR